MRILIVSLICLSLGGCASAVMKSGCGHLTGNEVTIPYVGGKANGNAYGCYMACVGSKCAAPDWNALATLNAAYLNNAAKDNTIKTMDGGTIIYNPPSK